MPVAGANKKRTGHEDSARYPPDLQAEATKTVFEQAEALCAD